MANTPHPSGRLLSGSILSQPGVVIDPNVNVSVGQEPQLVSALKKLASNIGQRIYVISGYRTPAQSVAVGGFANDPHTQGRAVDIGVGGQTRASAAQLTTAQLRAVGLYRPFAGATEINHLQLLKPVPSSSQNLAQLWTDAGGNPNLANIMAAIAMAESSGRVGAVGGPNTNGTYDYGLWQINSSHTQFDTSRLTTDPLYNAQAAVSIEKSQGLGAWSTYNSGAYRTFLSSAVNSATRYSITRPGGEATAPSVTNPTGGSGGSIDAVQGLFADYEQELNPDTGPQYVSLGSWLANQTGISGDLNTISSAVHDANSFISWVSWIFSPRNLLRVVEFLVGMSLFMTAFLSMISGGSGSGAASALISQTPLGRLQQARSGRRAGSLQGARDRAYSEARRAARNVGKTVEAAETLAE